MASGDANGTVWIWNLESGKGKAKFETTAMASLHDYEKAIECVEFVPKLITKKQSKDYLIYQYVYEGETLLYHLVAAAGAGNMVFVWDFVQTELAFMWRNCEEKVVIESQSTYMLAGTLLTP